MSEFTYDKYPKVSVQYFVGNVTPETPAQFVNCDKKRIQCSVLPEGPELEKCISIYENACI